MQRLRIYWFIFIGMAFASVFALSTANAQGVSDEDETTLHFPEEDIFDRPTRPVAFQTAASAAANDCSASEAAAMACYVSEYRARYHLPRVRLDSALTRPAQNWSNRMARRRILEHPANHMPAAPTAVSENVGYGYRSARAQVDGWIDSPEHRADMLIPNLHRIGVGVAVDGRNRKWWTADFGI